MPVFVVVVVTLFFFLKLNDMNFVRVEFGIEMEFFFLWP